MAKTLTPEQAAAVVGKTVETLRRWRRANIGPPFVMEGGKPRYRSDLLEAGSYETRGEQATFPTPAFSREGASKSDLTDGEEGAAVPVHIVVTMIERWKQRELYRRAQNILTEPFGADTEFKNELRMFGEPWPQGREEALDEALADASPTRRQEIFKSMDDQSGEIARKLRALWDSEGLPPSLMPSLYQVASSLLEDAWEEVVMAEQRWRELDYSGMPTERPR